MVFNVGTASAIPICVTTDNRRKQNANFKSDYDRSKHRSIRNGNGDYPCRIADGCGVKMHIIIRDYQVNIESIKRLEKLGYIIVRIEIIK